jgi:hypothetical protein
VKTDGHTDLTQTLDLVNMCKKFSSTASVRNAVTDSSVVEMLNELKRTELVSADDLKMQKQNT